MKLDARPYENLKPAGPAAFPFHRFTMKLPDEANSILLHWHGNMEILLVRGGQGTITVDLEPCRVVPGDICLILPGQLQALEPTAGETLSVERYQFPLDILSGTDQEAAVEALFQPLARGVQLFPWHITREFAGYDPLLQCLDEITQLTTFYPAAYPLAVKSKLYQVFYILYYNEPKPEPKNRPQKSVHHAKLLLQYIAENYTGHLGIAEMARVCGFSESHFIKFFKSVVGLTFTEYLNLYRLYRAAELLSTGRMPVCDVAEACGFGNVSYFNRLFRQKFGSAPTAFRKEGRQLTGQF